MQTQIAETELISTFARQLNCPKVLFLARNHVLTPYDGKGEIPRPTPIAWSSLMSKSFENLSKDTSAHVFVEKVQQKVVGHVE